MMKDYQFSYYNEQAEEDAIHVKIMIQVHLPCPCSKRYQCNKSRPTQVRSPFNLLGAEKGWEGNEFLNYWNLNQTFLMEGRSTISMIERFIKILKV